LIGLAPPLEFHYRFDSSADRCCSAFVNTATDQVVEFHQEFFREPNGDLFCSHA